MSGVGLYSNVNTNPMVFEDLAMSLATLATYARGNMDEPFQEMEHLFGRALQLPPSYSEITALTGHSLQAIDKQRGRAAWLLMNAEGLSVAAVHTKAWHKVSGKYSAPLVSQVARLLGVSSALDSVLMQELGADQSLLDVVGIQDDTIWLVQVVSSDKVVDSAVDRVKVKGRSLARGQVYMEPEIDEKSLQSLIVGKKQMEAAFPNVAVATLALVLHPVGPDFELYLLEDLESPQLQSGQIRRNSIDFVDRLHVDHDSLFALPQLLDNHLFRGIPPCRGGRTLGMLASAVSRQLQEGSLCLWTRSAFAEMLAKDFDYEIELDKIRHDLDDRLVAQGFFRKWGPEYYVSMKGVARYQYCLAKFTSLGLPSFCLDQCVLQRDRILAKFGCLS